MVVVILEKVPASVRGELTRWMLELRAGVFVGDLSAMVRDTLWKMICRKVRNGAGMLIHSAANEQGFEIHFYGDTSRAVEDFDGLKFIRALRCPHGRGGEPNTREVHVGEQTLSPRAWG